MTRKLFIGVVPLIVAVALAMTPMAARAASPAHYFLNGLGPGARAPGGEKLATIAWGTLSLTNLTTGGKVVCHFIIGGVVENPEPGGEAGPAGVGETQSVGAYECESEECSPAYTGGAPGTYPSVFAEGSDAPFPATGRGTMTSPNSGTTLPTEEPLVASGDNLKWKGELFIYEGTKVKQETDKVKINVICHVETAVNAKGESEYGEQFPEVLKGNLEAVAVTHCCTPLAPPELQFRAGSRTLENEKGQKTKIESSLKVLGFGGEEVINSKIG